MARLTANPAVTAVKYLVRKVVGLIVKSVFLNKFALMPFAFATMLSSCEGGGVDFASLLEGERRRAMPRNGVPDMGDDLPCGGDDVAVDDVVATGSIWSGANLPTFLLGRALGMGNAGWAKQLLLHGRRNRDRRSELRKTMV